MKPRVLIILSAVCVTAIILSAMKPITAEKDFVQFDKNLFASRYEVTNIKYREFLQDLKSANQTEKYATCRYDSTQWTKKFPSPNSKPMLYHSHPAYDHFPVVNITTEGAQSYCEWLTNRYNKDSKRTYKKVLFRLPTETEWKRLSGPLPGHNLPWYGNFPYADEHGKTFLANLKVKDQVTGNTDYIADGGMMTLIVGHYKPNNLGIYDVIGNVCEMTADGRLKGGSWDNYLDECTIDKTQTYSLPDPRVGFRVIMEVVEE